MTDFDDDPEALRLRDEVVRLIHAAEASWGRIGEHVSTPLGPVVFYSDDDPATAVPLAEYKALSGLLCRAISDFTLRVKLESGPVRYRGSIYHPIQEGQGHAWTCIINPDEAVDIEDAAEGGSRP